jgi:hypothetical protein
LPAGVLAAAAVLALTHCTSTWTTGPSKKRTLRIAVESEGGEATVSVNGYHCGRTPANCRIEVTESDYTVHTRKDYKLIAGYVVGVLGLTALGIGLPILAIRKSPGKAWLYSGAGLTVAGGVLTALAIGFLISWHVVVEKERLGVQYMPKDIVVEAVRQGRYRQRVKLKTKVFVKRPAFKPLKFKFGP